MLRCSTVHKKKEPSMPDQKSGNYDFSKFFTPFQFPGLPVDQIASTHRRNIEAATTAAQITFDFFQTVFSRQMDALNQSATDGSNGLQHLFAPGAPTEKLSQNADLLKSSLEKGLSNFREVANILVKSSTEATEILAKRASESLNELTGSLAKA
jgi:phasin family protein